MGAKGPDELIYPPRWHLVLTTEGEQHLLPHLAILTVVLDELEVRQDLDT